MSQFGSPYGGYTSSPQTTSAMVAAANAAGSQVMIDAQKDRDVEQKRMERAMGFRPAGGVQSPGGRWYGSQSPGGSFQNLQQTYSHPFQGTGSFQGRQSPGGYYPQTQVMSPTRYPGQRSPGGRLYGQGARSPSGNMYLGGRSPGGRSYSGSLSPGGRALGGVYSPGGTSYGYRSPGGSYWTAGPEVTDRRKLSWMNRPMNVTTQATMAGVPSSYLPQQSMGGLPSVGGYALPQSQGRSPMLGQSFVMPPNLMGSR